MIVSIRQVIDEVQSMYSKGAASKDSRLSDRLIYSCLIDARATIIRQISNKRQYLSNWIYQIIPRIELELSSVHEVPNAPTDCHILKNKYQIPSIISDSDGMLIRSVTDLNGNQRFTDIEFTSRKYQNGNKYTGSKPKVYIRNSDLYITSVTMLEAVAMEASYEDTIEVYTYPSTVEDCEGCECEDILDREFPIDRNLKKILIDMTNSNLVILFKQMQEDKTANTSDDTISRAAMVHQPNQDNNG